MVYHKDNFQRQIKCQRKIDKFTKKCEYFETCYAIHSENNISETNNEKYFEISNKYQKLKEKALILKKSYEELKEKFEEVQKENNFKSRLLSCRNCERVFPNYEIIMISFCEHLICNRCLDLCLKKNNKRCILCNQEIKKNSLLKVDLIREFHEKNSGDENDEDHSEEENEESVEIKNKEEKKKMKKNNQINNIRKNKDNIND